MSKIAWKMKQNPTNELFTLILGSLLSLVAKVSQVSFCPFCLLGELWKENKSLCHEIVFSELPKRGMYRVVCPSPPPAYPPQCSVILKTDSLPGNQLQQSWTCARQDSNCNLLCEQNRGAVHNCLCGDYCETRYGGSPWVLPGWDQTQGRFAFGMPVDVGERVKEKTGSLWKELYNQRTGQTNAEGMTLAFV